MRKLLPAPWRDVRGLRFHVLVPFLSCALGLGVMMIGVVAGEFTLMTVGLVMAGAGPAGLMSALSKPPPPEETERRGSDFVNVAPDGKGGGVWVDRNAPRIPVSSGGMSAPALSRREIEDTLRRAEPPRGPEQLAADLDAMGEHELARYIRERK